MGNKFLGPNQGLTIREPTDGSLAKGNIRNPPRFANLGMGGLNSASAAGITKNEFGVKTPGATQRDMPSSQKANSAGDKG